jgi:hypothetical protein
MQSVYFKEIEAAYMRRRMHDAAVASSLAAQAVPPRTGNRRPFFPSLILACQRARKAFRRQRPLLGPIPSGRELPAA